MAGMNARNWQFKETYKSFADRISGVIIMCKLNIFLSNFGYVACLIENASFVLYV